MKARVIILLAVMTFSCAEREEKQREAIRSLLQQLIDADNREDIATVLSCYTDAAVLVPPGRPLIAGHEAIRKNYEGIFASGSLALKIEIDTVIVSGVSASGYGHTLGSVTTEEGVKPVRDRYIVLLAMQRDQWKITRLMWSPE